MLELFRRNQLQYYLFVLLYAILISVPFFIQSTPQISHTGGYFYEHLKPFLEKYEIVAKILGFVIIMIQIVFLNRIANIHHLTVKSSLLPGIFYVLFMNYYPEFISYLPESIANLFLILGIGNLMNLDVRKRKPHRLINSSLFFSLASLFYPIYLTYILAIFIFLQILSNIKTRDFFFILFGAIVPYYFYGVFVYLIQGMKGIQDIINQKILFFSIDYEWLTDPIMILKLSIFSIIILMVYGNMNSLMNKMHIQFRKKINAAYIFMTLSILVSLFGSDPGLPNMLMILPTLSILLTAGIIRLENNQIAEVIHFILLAGFIIFQFILPNNIL